MVSNKATQIGLHSVRNMLGENAQYDLFSNHDIEFASEFNFKLSGKIDRFGIDLTEMQSRIMEGILRGFSETRYQGNIKPKPVEWVQNERFSGGKLPDTYKNIIELPCLKASLTQILDWSGINKNGISYWARAVEAIQELGVKQFCFYYDRLVFDDKGNPQKESNGRWKKEEVIAVDTLFTIKEIREESSGELKYYEITPSSIFLDQRDSYFMLIPYDWREEVKALVGNKKASSYTFRFLLYLRYQYELMRRSTKIKSPYQIKHSPEEIAIAIKMPESIYKRKKQRMNEILSDAFLVAKKLGYLTDYERKDYIDVLTLNNNKYFNPKDVEVNKVLDSIGHSDKSSKMSCSLFDLFHSLRQKINKYHQVPAGDDRQSQITVFSELLNRIPFEDIEKLIKWISSHKFWSVKISNPHSLKNEFSIAWGEFENDSKTDDNTSLFEKHRQYAETKLSQYDGHCHGGYYIYVCKSYVEFAHQGQSPSKLIEYEDKDFISKVNEVLHFLFSEKTIT